MKGEEIYFYQGTDLSGTSRSSAEGAAEYFGATDVEPARSPARWRTRSLFKGVVKFNRSGRPAASRRSAAS
jgi:hypothetical protein